MCTLVSYRLHVQTHHVLFTTPKCEGLYGNPFAFASSICPRRSAVVVESHVSHPRPNMACQRHISLRPFGLSFLSPVLLPQFAIFPLPTTTPRPCCPHIQPEGIDAIVWWKDEEITSFRRQKTECDLSMQPATFIHYSLIFTGPHHSPAPTIPPYTSHRSGGVIRQSLLATLGFSYRKKCTNLCYAICCIFHVIGKTMKI
ncbi:unnamed protein product [Protopolystoma xenopodis]|uniref:Uncharacterized protein n=1 Tax=Protopolystoma xenopodis TaxID=117903 RepID=A0A448WA49_9PLAT|nr:unnamed protein product [Protopolystoma xenopodis]